MRVTFVFLVTAFLLVFSRSAAQNEAQNWYFGNMAGLSFSTTPPTVLLNNALNILEGCATISDAAGNLLFYTDGLTVRDKTHSIMTNGSGLNGNASSSQSGVIVKQPGNSNIYYIFTADAAAGAFGICYSIVDMTQAGGLGAVTSKNISLYTPSTEKIAAVRHANGTDIWIVTHEWNSDKFVTYLLSSSGLNPTPVNTSIGLVHTGVGGFHGYLKASPNGNKLGMARTVLSNSLNLSTIELYDFDNATGVISNSLSLSGTTYAYGCEFSPDGTKFYAAQWLSGGCIYQWDLCAGSNTAILSSEYTVVATMPGKGALQVAPDGKIYICRPYLQFLDVIQNPNQAGAACNYVTPGISVAPKTCTYGLPNFITFQATSLITCTQACNTVSFAAQGSATIAGWDFGDPGSGQSNTSTAVNPVHTYPGAGIYTVKLVASNCVGQYTNYFTVNTTANAVTLNTSPAATLCEGNSCTLTASGASSYTWNNSAPGPSVILTPTASGVYTVAATGNNKCVSTATQGIHVHPLPLIAITGPTSVCNGSKIVLTAFGASSYTWNGNVSGQSTTLTPTAPGSYTVIGTSTNNCASSATMAIHIDPLPIIAVDGPTLICRGTKGILTASGASTYTWSTNATNATISIAPVATTTYSVIGTSTLGCVNTKTMTVNYSLCTGLYKVSKVEQLSIYPNPVSGNELFVNTLIKGELSMYDISGSLKLEVQVQEGNSVIDLGSLSKGVYVIRYKTSEGAKEIRLVKTGD